MAVDNFQQFVQTQQVQSDMAAVQAIDACVKSLGIKESIDALGDSITEGLGNLIGAGVKGAVASCAKGGQYIEARSQGPSDNPSGGLTPNISQAKAMASPDIGQSIPQPVMEMARASVQMPTIQQPPVDIPSGTCVSPHHCMNVNGIGGAGMGMNA